MLMQELGPDSADIVLIQQAGHRWQVDYEDGESAFVSQISDEGRIELMARAGPLPESAHPQLLEALLAFNLLGAGNGGVRAGLQMDQRSVCLLRDLDSAALDTAGLRDALRSLVALACNWRPVLSPTPETSPFFNPKELP